MFGKFMSLIFWFIVFGFFLMVGRAKGAILYVF